MIKKSAKLLSFVIVSKCITSIIGILFLISGYSNGKEIIDSEELTNVVSASANLRVEPQYMTYVNARYGFSLSYPNSLIKVSEADNGDGAKFISQDKKAILTVYGSNNVPYEHPEMLFKKDMSMIQGNVKLKTQDNNGYSILWINNGIANYRRVNVGMGSMNSIIFQYPEDQGGIYDPLIEYFNKSFKPGNLLDTH